MIATWILAAGTLALVACTLLPLWRHPHWLVRCADFPRPQLVALSGFLLTAQALWLPRAEGWWHGLPYVTGLCLVWHLAWVLPYTPLWPREVQATSGAHPARTLRIVTANVLGTNRDSTPLLKLVRARRPDVLVTLESDLWWQDQLDALDDMPYRVACPQDNLYGMHVYSRLPLEETAISFLVEAGVPSIHARIRLRCGVGVRASFLHPAPPSPTENTYSSERDAELILVARSVAEQDGPSLVTGDLNDVAWSATTRLFRRISGLLDPRVGRGLFNTFHAGWPCLRWPLDHLFHSSHFALANIERLPPIGSDHFALLTELVYDPEETEDQDGLGLLPEDAERAEEILAGLDAETSEVPKVPPSRELSPPEAGKG